MNQGALQSSDPIDIIIPQESDHFQKLPTYIIMWQPYFTPYEYTVLCYLTSRIHKKYQYAFPSIETAADDCNISENTFTKSVVFLEKIGLIYVDRNFRSNHYYLKPQLKPSLELLTKHIPEKIDKFIRRQKKSLIPFKKLPIKKSPQAISLSPSNPETSPSFEIKKNPHEMRTNSNSLNSNLENSHQHLEQRSNSTSSKLENKSVVDISKVNTLKNHGITHKRALELSRKIDPNTNLNNFIQFIVSNACKNREIYNKPGFIVYAIENDFEKDYLEKLKSEKQRNHLAKKAKDTSSKADNLRKALYQKAEEKWKAMGEAERSDIKLKTLIDNPFLRDLNFSEATFETFYVDYVKKHLLGLDQDLIDLLDSNDPVKIAQNADRFRFI